MENLQDDPEYKAWLTDLKSLAEKFSVTIDDVEHKDALIVIFAVGHSPITGLSKYKEFVRCYNLVS